MMVALQVQTAFRLEGRGQDGQRRDRKAGRRAALRLVLHREGNIALRGAGARHGAHGPVQLVVSGGQGRRPREQDLGCRFKPRMKPFDRLAIAHDVER